MKHYIRSLISPRLAWVIAAALVILICDQVSKEIVVRTIPERTETVFDHPGEFFWITHQRNTGLVGGMFSDRRGVPFVAPIVATLVLIYLYRHLDPASRFQALAFGMVVGGAIGNLIDRFRFGSVTDFLQFHFIFIPFDFPWKLYPAFNVADSAICVGVVLLVLLTWRQPVTTESADVSGSD